MKFIPRQTGVLLWMSFREADQLRQSLVCCQKPGSIKEWLWQKLMTVKNKKPSEPG